MAAVNVKGVNKTLIDAGGENTILQGQIDARLKVIKDSYVTDGTEGIGSTIKFGSLIPTGARIFDIIVFNEAMGAGATFSIGDSNSANRYNNAYDANGKLRSAGADAVGGSDYVIGTNTGDNQLLLTTAGATLAAGKRIEVAILYTLD